MDGPIDTSTMRAREDSSAASSISLLKKQHDDLFIEITKRLNYAADGDAHAALFANGDFAYLGLSGDSDPNLFKAALDKAFHFIGEGLSRAHGQDSETNPTLFDKWHIAFQLRTAILHASPRRVNVDPGSSLQCYPGLPNVEKAEILSPGKSRDPVSRSIAGNRAWRLAKKGRFVVLAFLVYGKRPLLFI